MGEKVRLPKEVAEAIDRLRRLGNDNRFLISMLHGETTGESSEVIRRFVVDDYSNFDKVLSAIVNGYTAETTPEDNVRKYYEASYEKDSDAESGSFNEGYYDGVTDASRVYTRLARNKVRRHQRITLRRHTRRIQAF